jgi:hypothetical protein
MGEPVSCRFFLHSLLCSWLYTYPSGLIVGMTVKVKDRSS